MVCSNIGLFGRSVQVNGEEVATERDIRGMFLRHSIDVTQQVAKAKETSNSLELHIRPPDHVGCVDRGCALHHATKHPAVDVMISLSEDLLVQSMNHTCIQLQASI